MGLIFDFIAEKFQVNLSVALGSKCQNTPALEYSYFQKSLSQNENLMMLENALKGLNPHLAANLKTLQVPPRKILLYYTSHKLADSGPLIFHNTI